MLLALGLDAHGYAVEVAGPRESAIAGALESAGVPHHELPFVRSYRRPDAELKVAAAISRLIRERGIDLVHSHSSKAGVHGRRAALAAGVPSVYSPHCFGFVGPVKRHRKLAAVAIERSLAGMTNAIICVCEAERQRALELAIAPPERLYTVLNGIPAPDPTIAPHPRLAELRRRGPLVGAVNVLRAQKRADVLIDAIGAIWRDVPQATFAIVGNGPMEAGLRARAAGRGVLDDERFLLLPFSAPSVRYLQALDLFVLPSDWEALPIGLLEAMASGVPQLATDVEGNREAVTRDTGRLIPTGDPGELARAAVELLRDPVERERLAAGSKARYHARFTVTRMVRETVGVYGSVLGREHASLAAPHRRWRRGRISATPRVEPAGVYAARTS